MKRWKTSGVMALLCAATSVSAAGGGGRHPDLPDPDFDFRSFFVTWGGTRSEAFTSFLRAARPEIVQAGFYGPLFHGYADNPKATGYPMQLDVGGQRAALDYQRQLNAAIHRSGARVVGHFQMVNAIANTNRWDDFLEFYEHRWPEDLLGPRPHPDVRELLQRDAQGRVLMSRHYVDYVGLCWSSPYAREALKRMLKLAVDSGVDGVMVNYNYRWACVCPYCQSDFRAHLAHRFSPGELASRFGITNLASAAFERIAAEIPGYPATNAAPLDWEAMRWGARAFKQRFDEIFLEYGRSLKPDLIVATWDHLGDMSIGEERAFTPGELWGRGENYFWYSGGYGPTDLKAHKAADAWLQCLYIREMTGGKPFMMGKYENTRMRSSIGEGLATGGAGMGLTMAIGTPDGFRACSGYLRFPRRHPDLYAPREALADVALVFPRQSILAGGRGSMDAFRSAGKALIDAHVLVDVLVDERLTAERLTAHRAAVLPRAAVLTDEQIEALDRFSAAGGRVIAFGASGVERPDGTGREAPSSWLQVGGTNAAAVMEAFDAGGSFARCAIDAPWTLRVCGFREPGRRILHFVNFNRDEEAGKSVKGAAAECSVPAEDVRVRLVLAPGEQARRIRSYSPDRESVARVPFSQCGDRLEFAVPRVEVYEVVEIRTGGWWPPW